MLSLSQRWTCLPGVRCPASSRWTHESHHWHVEAQGSVSKVPDFPSVQAAPLCSCVESSLRAGLSQPTGGLQVHTGGMWIVSCCGSPAVHHSTKSSTSLLLSTSLLGACVTTLPQCPQIRPLIVCPRLPCWTPPPLTAPRYPALRPPRENRRHVTTTCLSPPKWCSCAAISVDDLPLQLHCRKLCHWDHETEVTGVDVNGSCPFLYL